MKAERLVYLLMVVFFSLRLSAEAQQPAKIPRIGFLSLGSFTVQSPRQKAFHEKLRELGYIEGQNLTVAYRFADGNVNRLPELAEELIRSDVSIIVTTSTSTLLAASKASRKIPIVAATSGDLEGTGLVNSLARPGGHVTGLTALSPELSGKRLELLKEIAPKTPRVAVVWNPSKWDEKEVSQTQVAASVLGIRTISTPLRSADDFQSAYAKMLKEGARAVIIIQGPFLALHRKKILELNSENRLPSICDDPIWTDNGCLASYGPNRNEMYRRAAYYVDRILKGVNPADLPVEQPTKFELVINLKTAKQIGLTIPPNVLARADRVIR